MSDGKHGYGALMAIMAALLVALVALAMAAKEAEAFTPVKGAPLGFGVRCDPTVKTAQVDPIVYPGQHDVGHLHDFFGAQNINPDSRPDSIRQGITSCALSGDKAAYWVPAALNTSVHQMIAYYTPVPGKDNSPLNPYSEHLQMIAGSVPMDGDETPSSHVLWGCQGELATSNRPVDCGAGNHAKVEVFFPNCQAVNSNGPVDDSANHRSHMAYSDEHGHCPDSHPRKVVQLHVHVIYQQSDARNLNFSVPWYDFHADIMNGWDEAVLKQAIDECITDERYGCQRISDESDNGSGGGGGGGGSGGGSGGGGGSGSGGGNNDHNDHNDHNNRHYHNRFHHNRFHHNRFHHNRFHHNAAHIQYERTVEGRVIKETIPDKGTLANTGGSPLILLACVVLLSTGLLLGRSVIRRAL